MISDVYACLLNTRTKGRKMVFVIIISYRLQK